MGSTTIAGPEVARVFRTEAPGQEGVGIARVPAIFCRDAVRDGRLKVLFSPRPAMLRPIHAVYPSRLNLPAKVRLFVDALATLAEPTVPLHSGSRRKRS